MATLNVFVSFEFDKDDELKNSFYEQAREHTDHRIRNCSLNEAYPDEYWKNKARNAIRGCDVVLVLIGQDTHNAPGVEKELTIANQLKKPIFQIRPQGKTWGEVGGARELIEWKWEKIDEKIKELLN